MNLKREEAKFGLTDIFFLFGKYKRFLVIFTFVTGALTLIISLLLPKIFTSTVTILSPELITGEILSGPLKTLSKQFSLGQAGLSPISILAVLNSKNMAKDIVKEFNLQKLYKTKHIEGAITILKSVTSISFDEDLGVISISVSSRDPQLSADIANTYISNLEKINNELKLKYSKPIAIVLDKAESPVKKSKPKIKFSTLIGLTIGLILSSLYAFIKEYFKSFNASRF